MKWMNKPKCSTLSKNLKKSRKNRKNLIKQKYPHLPIIKMFLNHQCKTLTKYWMSSIAVDKKNHSNLK